MTSKDCFIRGNVIRYIHFSKKEVDLEIIQDACKKENFKKSEK